MLDERKKKEKEIDAQKDRNRGRKEKITRRKDTKPKGLHGEITRLQKIYTSGYNQPDRESTVLFKF